MPRLPKRLERRFRGGGGVTGMAALSRRPAFLILLLSSNMALCFPLNCVAPSRPVPQDRSGAVAALVGRIASLHRVRHIDSGATNT